MLMKSIYGFERDLNLDRFETLIDIFSETVKNHAEKTACWFNDESISFQELDKKSNAVAYKLKKLSIGQGDIIGVYLPRGIKLHIAILGILKSGAAYIPFDSETPIERVESILIENELSFCFSESSMNNHINWIIDDFDEDNIDINLSTPDALAYVIFTSGSTGKPKGIPIKHHQISILLRSENSVLGITDRDVVYQGFSVSFDMWFEETWISYLAGATLLIADAKTSKSIDKLDQFLNHHHVTVLHAVPSLLSILNPQIPSLRIVNSGGEACTKNIVDKWSHSPITFYNSYGPTETTVSSSFANLHPGDEISVGRPLPNYSMAIVNDALEPIEIGQVGQLIISGACLSEGYLLKPELTFKVFLAKPQQLSEMLGDRIYLSGDLAKMDENGLFYILGRKDDQVKIRGYRIELGEIESELNSLTEIQQAAVAVKKVNNTDQLVAYIIQENDFDEKKIRNKLLEKLPSYMVPTFIIKLENFPFLTSGKVDKKQLPTPTEIKFTDTNYAKEPIFTILSELFPGQKINRNDDFFTDLGGFSMLAAQFVSEVRRLSDFEHVDIMDIYENRPIENLIDHWEKNRRTISKVPEYRLPNPLHYYLCWIAQTFSLFIIFGIVAAQIFLPFLGYYFAVEELEGHFIPLVIAVLLFCTVLPFSSLLIIIFKKIFLSNFREGDYPLWGLTYFRWWLQKHLINLIPKEIISNTPFYANFLRFFGAKVASDTQLSHFEIGLEDLVEIGKNVTISSKVVLNNAWIENGYLRLRKIIIKDDAYVGTSAIISGNCILEPGAELKDLSCLANDTCIPSNSIFEGSPATYVGSKNSYAPFNPVSFQTKIAYKLIFLGIIFLFPVLVLVPLAPAIISLYYLDNQADWYSFFYLFKTPIFSLIYIGLFIMEVILLTRFFQKSVKRGNYSIYSSTYLKKWFLDQLFSLSLTVIKPLFATIYISSLYRAMGAKVGNNTEISTATNVTHALFEIGDESFIADDVSLGETEIRNQELTLDYTRIGNKSFVGNSALIPQGYTLGHGMLIGVISLPPTESQLADVTNKDWFGSPPRAIPKREMNFDYPAELTYNPTQKRKLFRGIVEFLRILIPQSVILSVSIIFIAYTDDLLQEKRWHEIMFYFPIYYLLMVAIPCFVFTLIFKWLIVGQYKESQFPMWTWHVWKTEAVTSIYEALAVPFFLEYLKGTPYLPIFLRLLGVKIGKYVYMDSTDITEFDMVQIGNYCQINLDGGPQTHLFEDRIMKIGKVKIGPYSSIGARSVILYNTEIGDNNTIGSLSLVMKGEKTPINTAWQGIPIKN